MIGRLLAWKQRDESIALDTRCPVHGDPYDEHRRCPRCREDAAALLSEQGK